MGSGDADDKWLVSRGSTSREQLDIDLGTVGEGVTNSLSSFKVSSATWHLVPDHN